MSGPWEVDRNCCGLSGSWAVNRECYGLGGAAPALAKASLAGGVLRDLSDYGTVLRILRPHFASRKILEEVELAAPPNASGISPGSVLLKRIGDEVKLLTDRDDCEE
ncbi:unnamed protein product, partial [Cladocopium goreaui]